MLQLCSPGWTMSSKVLVSYPSDVKLLQVLGNQIRMFFSLIAACVSEFAVQYPLQNWTQLSIGCGKKRCLYSVTACISTRSILKAALSSLINAILASYYSTCRLGTSWHLGWTNRGHIGWHCWGDCALRLNTVVPLVAPKAMVRNMPERCAGRVFCCSRGWLHSYSSFQGERTNAPHITSRESFRCDLDPGRPVRAGEYNVLALGIPVGSRQWLELVHTDECKAARMTRMFIIY